MSFFTRFFPSFKSVNTEKTISGDTEKTISGEIFNKKEESEEGNEPGVHKVYYMSKAEFLEPIKDEYLQKIAQMEPEDLYDNYNPGPTKPDGSVNFECHCVSHLVASPCGYAFRKAITCQKAASPEELDKGACSDEFMEFMECAMKTQCFRRTEVEDAGKIEENPQQSPAEN